MIEHMKFVVLECLLNFIAQQFKPMENIPIDFHQIFRINRIRGRVKIIQIPKKVTEGVANLTISFGQTVEDFIRNTNVFPIIFRATHNRKISAPD